MSNPFESAATTPLARTYHLKQVRRVGVLSCGKVMAALYAVMGLVVGAFMALFSMAGMPNVANAPNAAGPAAMLGVGVASIVLLPIVYGIMGFVGGIIMGFVYNLIAGAVGGIEFETTDIV